MTPQTWLNKLIGSSAVPESWKRNMKHAKTTSSAEEIDFLSEAYLNEVREQIILSEDKARLLADTMSWIRNDAEVFKLFRLWHSILFCERDYRGEDISLWPLPIETAGTEHRLALFPAVVLLSGYRSLKASYEQRNIPLSVMSDTLSAMEDCMELYKEWTGKSGFGMVYMSWMLRHFEGKLYKLGRLEYELLSMGKLVRVYRHKQEDITMTFAEPGITYYNGGFAAEINPIGDDTDAWVSDLIEAENQITGHPITQEGRVERHVVSIDKKDWVPVLLPGDAVLSIHIPRKGKFDYEQCAESFSQAKEFFSSYFPEVTYRAFYCGSWLLDAQLRSLLDESSNLLQFQRSFHLFPIPGSDDSVYRFVFNCDKKEAELLPETTSLQRKIKQLIMSGGNINRAGGFILMGGETN